VEIGRQSGQGTSIPKHSPLTQRRQASRYCDNHPCYSHHWGSDARRMARAPSRKEELQDTVLTIHTRPRSLDRDKSGTLLPNNLNDKSCLVFGGLLLSI
jgi:hypothetical protein